MFFNFLLASLSKKNTMGGRDKVKTAPSQYPRIPFHLLRSAQLLSSIVVSGIMFYFIYHLVNGSYKIPWTFIILMAAAFFTMLALTGTIIMHCCCGLNPRFNMVLNSVLFVLWAVGFALLTWWMSGTLKHVCDKANWSDDTGIMICRIYKALFTFALVGFVSTLGALVLDIFIRRKQVRRGQYNAMQNLDNKATASTAQFGNFEDVPRDGRVHETVDDGVHQEQIGLMSKPWSVTRSQADYAAPSEQFRYDTEYRGSAGA